MGIAGNSSRSTQFKLLLPLIHRDGSMVGARSGNGITGFSTAYMFGVIVNYDKKFDTFKRPRGSKRNYGQRPVPLVPDYTRALPESSDARGDSAQLGGTLSAVKFRIGVMSAGLGAFHTALGWWGWGVSSGARGLESRRDVGAQNRPE